MSVQDLIAALDTYGDDEDYGSAVEYLYYEGKDIDTPAGRVKHVDSYRSWPNSDPMINVVVEFGGKFYHNDSYYDSWGGGTDWDSSDWGEVEQVEVVTKEWKDVR